MYNTNLRKIQYILYFQKEKHQVFFSLQVQITLNDQGIGFGNN